ncbi:BH1964 [Halalkalibacterium halodurans C-125]|uniref:BH1964 protein n=1 Tax=Halalkalibacterium halodurans (strain ATCC BAA-125 / DSM 18197 / FERM 7344 / JCM 9153 / C-125) TaxID=272558 RepID=Q9KBG4_HALH5|nr:PhzF family phenazine biosynthesis protein [Halalkalibacterium halodurans]BAB05683.1 BH1964 [Halalkalibacterium halodurans C-125]
MIQQNLLDGSASNINLHVKAGMIPISIDHRSEVFWMQQNEPTFGQTFSNAQLSKLLGIPEQYMDTRYPIQEVETGLPVIIVPLISLHAVKKVRIEKEHYYRLIEQTNAKGILVFSPETYHEENDLNVRDFADYYGIPEDPATGSSNGCLAAYLVKYRYLGTDRIDVRVEQGYEIGRPSLLFLRAFHKKSINVSVGGKVEKIAQGEWLL